MNYCGNELTLFSEAFNWKRYFGSVIRPYVGESVLEVGAGLGHNWKYISSEKVKNWVFLEPDPQLSGEIAKKTPPPFSFQIITGILNELPKDVTFDTILYLDVLEHIPNDKKEIESALNHLNQGGSLIILSPAFPVLWSPFDESIGHYRRYRINSLHAIIPKGVCCKKLHYLDSVGMIASLSNRFLLKNPLPTPAQIKLWDSFIVNLSKIADPFLKKFLGKSIIGIWVKK